MADVPIAPPPAYGTIVTLLQCPIDGVQWTRVLAGGASPHTHTETEWENYRVANSLQPGYPRYIAVGQSTVTPPPKPPGAP